ncbi:MAG: alpha/beta fold hydrolase [Daejeonella sp.]
MGKLYLQLIFLSGFLLMSLISCKQKPTIKENPSENYLLVDEKPNPQDPARIEELQINSSGSTIFGFEYVANGAGPHPTVILLHGIPGNERNLDIAQNLRRAGYNVLFFDYRGSWGSKGVFSFKNSLNDIDAVLNYITTPENSEVLRVDTGRIALVGHSMGAGLAMIKGIQDSRVKAVAGISVFNPYTIFQGPQAKGNILNLREYISTLEVLNCDPNTYLKNILNDVEDYNIEKLVKNSSKPLLIIDEHKNNNYLARYPAKKNLIYKMWNTDHAFTNKRIALSRELNNWLLKNLTP